MKILLIGSAGYVGSYLRWDLKTDVAGRFDVTCCDRKWFWPEAPVDWDSDYAALPAEVIAAFDAVILLAGHSSVAMCEARRVDAFHNNVANFVTLLEKLRPGQKLIYASSASVYGNTWGEQAEEEVRLPAPATAYDFHKASCDAAASLSGREVYGLRLGTVCGAAPHMRVDTMLNAMVHTARAEGEVRVTNRTAHRPLLALSDLAQAVMAILTSAPCPGLYNLGSQNVSVFEVAEAVASHLKVPIRFVPGPPTPYSMWLRTDRAARSLRFTPRVTLPEMVADVAANPPQRATVRTEALCYP